MAIVVGVYGATGYTGIELVRLLEAHPEVEIAFLTSESSAGGSLRRAWPQGPDRPLVAAADAPLAAVDAVFLCLPHGGAAPVAARALAAGARVVDLSADLRLADAAAWERWYGTPHPAPGLLPVPYGLPELGREALAGAAAVANPGCYATAVVLALAPLARAGELAPSGPLVVDAKSGVSGAGRAPRTDTVFCEVHGNCSPYSPGRRHRHVGEMEQALAGCGLEPGRLLFTPHLLPTDRGILASLYLPVADARRAAAALAAAYAGEALVEVLPEGELATLAHAVGSPRAVLSATPLTPEMLLVVSVLDNLLKGAASQAVQNFNLMWGLPETTGLVAVRRAA